MKGTTRKINSEKGGLFNFLAPLTRVALPLMTNVLIPLTKSVLVPLGLTAAMSATDAAIQKNIFGSRMTTLIFSNEEFDDIMKIVKCLEDVGLLIKSVSETIENEVKVQKGDFFWYVSCYSR